MCVSVHSASTGYMAQEFFSLPSYPGYSPNAVEAFTSVPSEGLLQIVAFMAYLEVVSNIVRLITIIRIPRDTDNPKLR